MSERDKSPVRKADSPPEHLLPLYRAYSDQNRNLMFIGPALTIQELKDHAAKVVDAYNNFHAKTIVRLLEKFTKPFVDECRFWLGREGSVAMWVEVPKGRGDDLVAQCRETDKFEVVDCLNVDRVKGWVNLYLGQLEKMGEEMWVASAEGDPPQFRDGCRRLLEGCCTLTSVAEKKEFVKLWWD